MIVYVVMGSDYEGDWIEGVYISPELAQRKHPGRWKQFLSGDKPLWLKSRGGLRIETHDVREGE